MQLRIETWTALTIVGEERVRSCSSGACAKGCGQTPHDPKQILHNTVVMEKEEQDSGSPGAGGLADLGLAGLELQKRKPQLAAAGDVGHCCAEGRPGAARVALDAVLESGKLHVEVWPVRGGGGGRRKRQNQPAHRSQARRDRRKR